MKQKKTAFTAVSLGAALCLTLVACGSSSGGGGGGGGSGNSASGYSAGNTTVVNASNQKGGTISYGISAEPDSTDPGNTYYAQMWDFVRLYGRTLLMYKPAPGKAGLEVVPDLATGLGKSSDGGKTWTYHIRSNVKYEDGTTVTSKDVKYAIERTFDRGVFPNGPSYFIGLLDPKYPGPYKDKSPGGLSAIQTPDATTIVFHLLKPFSDFDYLMTIPQTVPVPQAKDTGVNYFKHPISTGPYMFSSYTQGQGFTMVKNPHWSAATDPNRKQLADKVTVRFDVNANDLDSRLLSGDIDLDLAGTGVQSQARAKILSNPKLKADSDDALSGFLWFAYLDTKVKPFDNVHCRRAVEYATDKQVQQNAYGGPVAGGDIATTVLPPTVLGHQSFDLYEAKSKPNGDLAKAKSELKACGMPSGFSTNISARSDRPKEVAAAQGIQQALAKINIKSQIVTFPTGKYFTNFAGVPNYVHQHDIGIAMGGWAADWPEGYGFLDEIAAGDAIVAAGNTNVEELNDPQVNALLAKSASSTDASARNKMYGEIDKIMMQQAVILPEVYAKSLLYRSPSLTNVYVTPAYGMYNYISIGKK